VIAGECVSMMTNVGSNNGGIVGNDVQEALMVQLIRHDELIVSCEMIVNWQ
jgi:hypothetical protein